MPEWTVGDRLRKALDHAGVGVGEMAEYLGVERNTVGNYIHDRTRIPGPALKLWSMRTGVNTEWILTGQEQQSPRPSGPSGGRVRRAKQGTCGYLAAPVLAAA